MTACPPDPPDSPDRTTDVETPSLFWRSLGSRHAEDLARYGHLAVKRRQALRYFTWQWRWRSLHRSRQLRFLLRHSRPGTIVRCATARTDTSDAAWIGVPWSRPDRRLYAFATRLLWEHARRDGSPAVVALPEPELGQPLPVTWRGRLISQDLANTALEAASILRALDGHRPRHVLEIGAGYGRTAYALMSLFPDCAYTIVDIEPALSISRRYLTTLFPGRALTFLSPGALLSLPPLEQPLMVSVSSFQEMTHAQIAVYLERFDELGSGGVVWLKQRTHWRNPDDGIETRFAEYPIPARWHRLFDEQSDVQTDFRQAAWRVPPDA